jgi:hypothetical protein
MTHAEVLRADVQADRIFSGDTDSRKFARYTAVIRQIGCAANATQGMGRLGGFAACGKTTLISEL